jgi:hypothetical protein
LLPRAFSSLFEIDLRQSAASLEQLAGVTDGLAIVWPANIIGEVNRLIQSGDVRLYDGYYLQQARVPIGPGVVAGVLDAIRTRILTFSLTVEESAPDAGEGTSDAAQSAQVAQIFNTHIYGEGSNIAIGSRDVEQNMELPSEGDGAALMRVLEKLGVGKADLIDLQSAIDADLTEQTQNDHVEPHRNVAAWWARFSLSAGSVAGKMAIGAGGGLAARAIATYLGMH